MNEPVLVLEDVHRTFVQGRTQLEVLRGVNFRVEEGEIVALIGPSGSGKSTLLHIAGLLEQPDEGNVYISGEHCNQLNDDDRTRLRRHNIGVVYQYHHLLPEFSALENVVIPQIIAGLDRSEARVRAHELLAWLNLSERESHRPARLSGGEQQRVAIARALANAPRLLLADEPTGNLDPTIADGVFAVLMQLVRGAGLAAVIATHNYDLAKKTDRIVTLTDGVLVDGMV
jgi:lipoprotein-releasing system ATP-binding protein